MGAKLSLSLLLRVARKHKTWFIGRNTDKETILVADLFQDVDASVQLRLVQTPHYTGRLGGDTRVSYLLALFRGKDLICSHEGSGYRIGSARPGENLHDPVSQLFAEIHPKAAKRRGPDQATKNRVAEKLEDLAKK